MGGSKTTMMMSRSLPVWTLYVCVYVCLNVIFAGTSAKPFCSELHKHKNPTCFSAVLMSAPASIHSFIHSFPLFNACIGASKEQGEITKLDNKKVHNGIQKDQRDFEQIKDRK